MALKLRKLIHSNLPDDGFYSKAIDQDLIPALTKDKITRTWKLQDWTIKDASTRQEKFLDDAVNKVLTDGGNQIYLGQLIGGRPHD